MSEYLPVILAQQLVDVLVNLWPFISDGFMFLFVSRIYYDEVRRPPTVVSQVLVIQ
jgi:hypothetical protein